MPQTGRLTTTLNETLLANAFELALSERKGVLIWRTRRFVERNSVWIIGILLTILGGIGIVRDEFPLAERLSEAVFTTGILSITVDVWLKRKLQEEAARDIFQFLLGVNLPEMLRDKVQRFVEENAVYRENVRIDVDAEEDAGGVLLTVSIEATIVAAKATEYKQEISFEEAEQGEILDAHLRSLTSEIYQYIRPETGPLDGEPGVRVWMGPAQRLKRGDRIVSYAKYTVRRARVDYHPLFFATTVIEPRVRVTASDSLVITSSGVQKKKKGKKDLDWVQASENEYIYHKVFLAADHIQIRWRPRP